jgi:phosphoglycolate phosphatase
MTNLIFDYDGTLHNSIKIYAPAFRSAYASLVERGFAVPKEFSDQEISYWLGFTAEEMWRSFLPNLPDEERQKCSTLIGAEMLRLISNGTAELYPKAEQVLQSLQDKGYHLIFLSNCKRAYMEVHIQQFQLDRFFSAFYCSEDFCFIPKHEIFPTIQSDFSGDFIIIGDRFQDMDIAKAHKLQSIGCLYGYGTPAELESAAFLIEDLSDLLQLL